MVRLVQWDPDGEAQVLAAACQPYSERGMGELLRQTRNMPADDVERKIVELACTRENRRHRPGRAFEHTGYLFEVTCDYDAFRDLQRHRMLTMDWERLGTARGRVRPEAIAEMGAEADWERAMDGAAEVHEQMLERLGTLAAQYPVPMAYRIRCTMRMNAREAMHVLELRTQPAGHPAYRAICQRMHELIREQAGH